MTKTGAVLSISNVRELIPETRPDVSVEITSTVYFPSKRGYSPFSFFLLSSNFQIFFSGLTS